MTVGINKGWLLCLRGHTFGNVGSHFWASHSREMLLASSGSRLGRGSNTKDSPPKQRTWPRMFMAVGRCCSMKTRLPKLKLVQLRSLSDSLRPHGLQHARLPCPSPTPGACSNSCPSCWWYHPTISSSVVPFSSCLQSFPASGSFLMSQFFASWPKYWSFSFSISPPNEYSGLISFRIDWFDLLAVQGTLKSLQRIIQLHFTQFHMKLLLQNSFYYTSHGTTDSNVTW